MKNIKYLSVLLVLGFLFVSCEASKEKEWKKLYGYTNEDIVGAYSFSKVEDAFDALTEGTYCHICNDAQVTISASSASIIQFSVNCPNAGFHKVFEGRPRVNDDDYIINIGGTSLNNHPEYGLTAYVYENEQGDIRIHGYAQHIEWIIVVNSYGQEEYKIKSKTNYYFDVIKN